MTAADLHPDTGLPRPGTCCGVCPPIAGGGWDCTCPGLPDCPAAARAEAERHYPALNADDEALTYPRSAVREHARGGFVKGYEAGWAAALAAGRAETTTATTEDAQVGTFEAILAAHRDEYDSDCGMYFGCSCGWDNDDIGSNEGYVEHVARLLATARTRPTETTTEWGVRGMDVTLRAGSEQDARELLAKSADYVLVRREVGPWTEDVQ